MAEAAAEQEDHIINGRPITPQYATQDVPRYKKTIPELEANLGIVKEIYRCIFLIFSNFHFT